MKQATPDQQIDGCEHSDGGKFKRGNHAASGFKDWRSHPRSERHECRRPQPLQCRSQRGLPVDAPARCEGGSGDEMIRTASSLAGKWKYVTGTFIIFCFFADNLREGSLSQN